MPRIKIDLIEEGMVVGSDVKNMDNMLLIPSGCALTERQIHILKAWGVDDIEVTASVNADDEGWTLELAPEACGPASKFF